MRQTAVEDLLVTSLTVTNPLNLPAGLDIYQPAAPSVNDIGLHLHDATANAGRLLEIEHYGAGDVQSYGLDIHNYQGAHTAVVIHNYSTDGGALQIDNVNTSTLLRLKNTENQAISPGTTGSGLFIDFTGYAASVNQQVGYLDSLLTFHSTTTTLPWTFTADAATNALKIIQGQAATGLQLSQNGAGTGLNIAQVGAGSAIAVAQSGGGTALSISCTSGANNFYPVQVIGYNYGPSYSTSQDGKETLTVSKNGAGTGTAQRIINKGIGLSLDIQSATASLWAVTAAGEPQWVATANQQTTVGAAGAGAALPATPVKFLAIRDSAGAKFVIPCYNP